MCRLSWILGASNLLEPPGSIQAFAFIYIHSPLLVSWRRHWKLHFVSVRIFYNFHFNEICALLGYYAVWSGNFVPTFRDNPSHLQSYWSPRIFHFNVILRFFPQEVLESKFFISYIQNRPHKHSPLQPNLWNTNLLEKLRVVYILKIFLASYATRRYFSEFQTANCSCLFWAWLIQSSPSWVNINFECILLSVDWLIVTGISKDFSAFIFRVQQSTHLGLSDL